jgi:hypothetical protein
MGKSGLIYFLIFIVIVFNESKAQSEFKRNTLFGEFGGSAGLISLNFDKRFSKSPEGFGVRIGAGYMAWQDTEIFNFPILVNYLTGKNGKYFELGFGPTIGYAQERQEPMDPDLSFEPYLTVFGSINLGYRYQPVNGGFNFRAGISPILNFDDIIPFWPYLSFGYSF